MRRSRDHREATTLAATKREQAADGWSLVVIGSHALRAHALPRSGSVVIGRTRDADIQLDEPSISRRHCILHLGEGMELEDLGSANGCRVRDHKLAARQRVVVSAGEPIEIGMVLLVIQPRAAAASAPPALIIDDAAMKRLHRIVDRIAVGTIGVLLLGETGVGKEVMARTIHDRSQRSAAPFVSVNCAALSEQLLESELFGYEKGAFTGADRPKPGLFETADTGTLFLDEIGELPLVLQAKLLRVVEQREVLRVGALKPRPIDIRFIAATNRNLADDVSRGAFRRDLYFRLDGVSLVIPPLRERRSELSALAAAFVTSACTGRGSRPVISDGAMARLIAHDWPGNIRELRNVIGRAVLLADDVIDVEHVQFESIGAFESPPPAPASADLQRELGSLERQRILEVLAQCGGNQSRAAVALGISRGTLAVRLKGYGVLKPRQQKR